MKSKILAYPEKIDLKDNVSLRTEVGSNHIRNTRQTSVYALTVNMTQETKTKQQNSYN